MPPKTNKYKEDLIPRIRDLIDGYSSASILKEYLQNADDSGATELVVTFDKQSYQNLKDTKYESAMGASLLLSNNSIFKEKDFENIIKIGAQGKSSDASSTGRFGQGFSASFSISDHPTFLSSNRVYWFDVLKTAVSKDEDDDILYWENSYFNEISNWLKTFEVADFNDLKTYNGTIFRLPLRYDNNDSKISNQVFTFDDFLLWCNEWKDKAESLLFLRNIHTLTLQEIDENGKKIIHLEIKTKNSKEIQKINNSIQAEFGDDELMDICNRWKLSEINLPLFSYHHNFSIVYWNKDEDKKKSRDETWAVINGLFRGENNCLIDKAIDVLQITPNPRKVLPWAGVALCIDEKKKPIKKDSQWYTFLPLPIESSHPIQLHGWFDLNPKRTEITNDGTGKDKETLISWNQQLLEHGVGVAWALLIDYIKDEKHLDNYYNFWVKKESHELDKYLIKGFYHKISELKCFYVHNKNHRPKWLSPKEELHYFKDENNKILFKAFKKHFSIISPKPQKSIIENFENIDIELTEIKSEYVRNFLNEEAQDIEFPVFLDNISIDMLKRKKSLIEIIKYCADNGEDYSLLDELPLKLTLDTYIYQIGTKTLFDKNPNVKLFQDMKSLYIDIDVVNSIENTDTIPSSWVKPTLKSQLSLLLEYWDEFKISIEWIEEIINLIINANKNEFDEAIDDIKNLQIVYQENKEYGYLDSNIEESSPFIIRDEDIINNIPYLKEIKLNIIHSDYVKLYTPLLKYDGLITEFNSKNLIQHILMLDNFSFFENKGTREYILDVLVEDISWFDELSGYEDELNSIAFIQTVNDNLYAKNTNVKLFLPTDFTPPEHIESLKGKYELISVDANPKLFELYKKMGIEEQSISNYIQDIIIPFLETIENISDNKEILKWLALEWTNIKDKIDDTILGKLKGASIIPNSLDKHSSYKASELYLPTKELPTILNDNKYQPIYFEDVNVQNSWINLLRCLESSILILPQHIKDKVVQIAESNNKKDSILLLNYIANNFEIFAQMDILDTLKEYAWFPVEKPNYILKPKNKYTVLKRADELILPNDLKIAGGYYHVLNKKIKLGKKDDKGEYNEKEMANKFGIVTNISNEAFFESFRELMGLSPINGQVVNYAKEAYKYIGRKFKDKKIDFDIEEKTILIDNQWIASKYVFQYKINLTGIKNWEKLVGNETESNLAKGLISLGVKEKPTFDFFIEQLQKLPQEQDLKSHQLEDAKTLLREIQNEDESPVHHNELTILTGNNQLVLSSNLYINDLPAYKNSEDKNKNLKFCQSQFDRLAERLGVLALSENYTSEITNYEKSESTHEIVDIMQNDPFKEGVLRLLCHEKKVKEDEINESLLQEVLPSNLIFVSQLIIKYSIEDNFLFRSNETTYENDGELYILEQDDEDDMIEVISKYICDTKNLSRDSFGWIERILRHKMNRENIHDFLDKKKVIELPKKFDTEDEVSIFDDSHSTESDKEIIYANSTNQEENSKSKGEIAPFTKPKVSYENENTNNHNSSNSSNNNIRGVNKNSFNYFSNKSNKKIVSSNDRKPVYVGKDREIDEEQQKSQRESAKEIGDKGENYILANKETLLFSKTNYFEKAPNNNKGFDIYEKDESGQTIRYIEVKTLTGQWGQGGVGITEHQLEFAQQEKDKWWLFVIENINTNNTTIYQFKNPVLEANKFMFDSSWKQLSCQSKKIEN